MRVIGLTGGIAAGKSTISQILAELGAVVIDADKVGHEAYRRGTEAWRALVAHFGEGILTPDGEIDRRKLGAIVFADPAERRALQDIVWPRMKEMIRQRLAELRAQGTPVAVIEAAVLIEAGWTDLVDEVWVVQVPEDVALQRLVARNNLSEADARARIRAQLSNAERAAHADVIIDNSGTVEEARAQVERAWTKVAAP
ncbi:MAG: dephospho-CoA kinase [Chloroflexota bacterium]